MIKKPEVKSTSKISPIKLLVAVVLALLLLVLLIPKKSEQGVEESAIVENAIAAPESGSVVNRAPVGTAHNHESMEEEPEHNAQVGYLVEDFRDKSRSWAGYKFENVRQTDQGMMLNPGETNGVIESPALILNHPSSTIAPLWKEETPDGTGVKVEMAISGDNQTWSAWYPIDTTGDDISPIYPDGSPNPNYGYVPGTMIATGLQLSPFVKYRFTLEGESGKSPLLSGTRIFHVDSTGGEGKIVSDYPPGPPSPEGARSNEGVSDSAESSAVKTQ